MIFWFKCECGGRTMNYRLKIFFVNLPFGYFCLVDFSVASFDEQKHNLKCLLGWDQNYNLVAFC
jgi:hypothetical protein